MKSNIKKTICLFSLSFSLSAQAEMLAEVHDENYPDLCRSELARVEFCLGYYWIAGSSDPHYEIQVGCENFLDVSAPVVRDYNMVNTPDFEDFALQITDGIDQEIRIISLFIDSHTGVSGIGQEEPESILLGSSPDLKCSSIEFVRLVVNELTTYPDPLGTGDTCIGGYDIDWQIWGVGAKCPIIFQDGFE